ncbi:hypothetical protein GCM10007863_36510 [Dyella mobilis]|nr:hypothetical protein GCM10007863_36510 [Dyella mobilis]
MSSRVGTDDFAAFALPDQLATQTREGELPKLKSFTVAAFAPSGDARLSFGCQSPDPASGFECCSSTVG